MTQKQFIKEAEKRFEKLVDGWFINPTSDDQRDPYKVLIAFIRQLQKEAIEYGRASKGEEIEEQWIQSIADNLGYLLSEGYGGGNWRRLIMMLKADFEKKLETRIAELKSKDTSK